MNKQKKSVHAAIDAGEIIKEYLSKNGKKGMQNRWSKKTPEERKEWGKFLASTRKSKLSTDDSSKDNV